MNMPLSGVVIFCEMIRAESDGKISILGAHGPFVNLSQGTEEIISLGIWGRFDFPAIEIIPKSLVSVVVERGIERIELVDGKLNREEQRVGRADRDKGLPLTANIGCQLQGIQVHAGDVIRATIEVGEFSAERTLSVRYVPKQATSSDEPSRAKPRLSKKSAKQ